MPISFNVDIYRKIEPHRTLHVYPHNILTLISKISILNKYYEMIDILILVCIERLPNFSDSNWCIYHVFPSTFRHSFLSKF